jgi:hypothetical protein
MQSEIAMVLFVAMGSVTSLLVDANATLITKARSVRHTAQTIAVEMVNAVSKRMDAFLRNLPW